MKIEVEQLKVTIMKKRESIVNPKLLVGAAAAVIAGAYFVMQKRRSIPKGVKAVKPLNIKKYMGKWYEIARIDYLYERGLTNTTADYSINKDGSISVLNRGFSPKKGEFVEAHGKAEFAGSTDEGKLKVSFFGPISSGYNVIKIDAGYNYALVAGEDFNHLWILSRKPTIPEKVKEMFLQLAEHYGYDTSRLTWVNHDGKK